jgi:hypothetical protein
MIRASVAAVQTHAQTPEPPPTSPGPALLSPGPLPRRGLPSLLFGLAQPLLGLRMVLREPALRRRAALPVICLAVVCGLIAAGADGSRLVAFGEALVLLAPVPVVLFGKTYRTLAAESRVPLGLSPGTAVHPGLWGAIGDAIRQSVLLAIALVPLYFVAELLRSLGIELAPLLWALGGAWALHWIVVEALDNGHTLADGAPSDEAAPDPWFVRAYQVRSLRWFAGLLRRLSWPWRRELAIVARRPELALGFGLGIAALLAVPLMALVFRPAVVVAAVHLLGRVAEAERGATP